tara:strand:+ start:425 stop:937 length:513 start_codon:yes stop_codon:yes gene_type:complete
MATNLEFIKSASGSGVSSLSVTNCFSDKYDVYKITFDIDSSTAASALDFGLRLIDSGGSVITASEYDRANYNLRPGSSFGEFKSTNTDKFHSHTQLSSSGNSAGGISYLFNPYDSSSYTFHKAQTFFDNNGSLLGKKIIGVHKVAEQITGINYFLPSDSFTGTINVFGVK